MTKNFASTKIVRVITVALVVAFSPIWLITGSASAASTANFKPGKIIDDGIFTNWRSMDVNQIGAFLAAKVPACDSNGMQPSEFGGGTRAQWGIAHNYPPPYTCLKDYSEGGRSAAQIIYDTAVAYKINPQVLIVLLQKEQGLVTDTWPLPTQYRTATGYGCPDTAPCDTQYFGLTNQLDWSGKMFRAIMNASPTWYTPYILGENYIRYNPSSSCGGTTVTIENRSTQALYNYTPYQPNQAALGAGYGNGNSCSSYGNRNFYLYFTDWFFSTIKPLLPACPMTEVNCVWSFRDDNTGEFFYTSDETERNVVNGDLFTYMGIHFYTRKQNTPGTIPVYRLYSNTGRHLWTTSVDERDQLVAGGAWTNEGSAFNVDPADSNTGDPVHRMYTQSSGGVHILTRDETYVAQLKQSGYIDEGISFVSVSPISQDAPPASGKQNVYRFNFGNEHFWTINARERDALIGAKLQYEGVGWQTASTGNSVYRLYDPRKGLHFWTTSVNERDFLMARGWRSEGTGWQTAASGSPIYRIYDTRLGVHFWTASSVERDGVLSIPVWRDEGTSWSY